MKQDETTQTTPEKEERDTAEPTQPNPTVGCNMSYGTVIKAQSPCGILLLPAQRPRAILLRGFSSCPFQILGLRSNGKRRTTTTASSLSMNPSSHRNNNHSYRTNNSVITYEEVRVAFRELALKHHPDTNNNKNTSGSDSDKKKATSAEEFTRIRQAFESIAEGPDGVAIVRDDRSFTQSYNTVKDNPNEMDIPHAAENDNSNYNAFQSEQNGYLHPSINPQILREVAEVAEEMNPGGLDKGGMWQYANMIRTMAERRGKDGSGGGLPPLRVDDGGADDANEKKQGGIGSRRRRRRR